MSDTQTISVRPSTKDEQAEILKIHEAAFERPDEAKLVEILLASDVVVNELCLVATTKGKIAGHILYTTVQILSESGENLCDTATGHGAQTSVPYALALAPLAVRPELQNQGLGSALMRESLKLADQNGHGIIIVLGHPEYYPRFGFEPASKFGMKSPFNAPDNVFMAKPLSSFKSEICGYVIYHDSFNQLD